MYAALKIPANNIRVITPVITTALVACLGTFSASALAQPAVYSDGQMMIPQGAMITENKSAYFTDIQLSADASGKLTITDYNTNPAVSVDSVDVEVMESFPLQVSLAVSGSLSVPCVELLPPAVSYQNNRFTVILAESVMGPAETCIAVLEPFTTSIPLPVEGLPAGDYAIEVNGVSGQFSFDTDNGPLAP